MRCTEEGGMAVGGLGRSEMSLCKGHQASTLDRALVK